MELNARIKCKQNSQTMHYLQETSLNHSKTKNPFQNIIFYIKEDLIKKCKKIDICIPKMWCVFTGQRQGPPPTHYTCVYYSDTQLTHKIGRDPQNMRLKYILKATHFQISYHSHCYPVNWIIIKVVYLVEYLEREGEWKRWRRMKRTTGAKWSYHL